MRRVLMLLLALLFAHGAVAPAHADPFAARHGLSAVDFEIQNIVLAGQHFRPRTLDAATIGGNVVYSGIWEPYDPNDPADDYTFDLDMTPAELQAAHDSLSPQGYHPVSVAGFEVSGSPHFAVIWHRDASVAYYWRAQLSSDDYQQLFESLGEKNICHDRDDRMIRLVLDDTVGRPGGNGLLHRIAAQTRGRGGNTNPQDHMPQSQPTPGCHFKLVDVDSYLDGTQVRYIAVWEVEKGGYAARHGMAFDNLVYDPVGSALEMTKVGSSPDGAGGVTYTAIWNVLPKEVRYTFPRLTGAQYQALFDVRANEGYTLIDIAMEESAGRTGGAPLYTSLWKAPQGPDKLLELHWPLAGVPGKDWTLVNYQDHDAFTTGQLDFMGNAWNYDGHNGTDISLRNFEEMDAGIDVVAAEDGIVRNPADGFQDRNTCGSGNCGICNSNGNTVFIEHANGLRTWYMHLKRNSIIVSDGQKVVRGQKLGLVGSSGNSSDAHLHFAVLKGPNFNLGVTGLDLLDPWEGPSGNSDIMWSVVPPYAPTVLNVMDADVSTIKWDPLESTCRHASLSIL